MHFIQLGSENRTPEQAMPEYRMKDGIRLPNGLIAPVRMRPHAKAAKEPCTGAQENRNHAEMIVYNIYPLFPTLLEELTYYCPYALSSVCSEERFLYTIRACV